MLRDSGPTATRRLTPPPRNLVGRDSLPSRFHRVGFRDPKWRLSLGSRPQRGTSGQAVPERVPSNSESRRVTVIMVGSPSAVAARLISPGGEVRLVPASPSLIEADAEQATALVFVSQGHRLMEVEVRGPRQGLFEDVRVHGDYVLHAFSPAQRFGGL